MKTKLLTALFCILPLFAFTQNYEKEGDDLFAQAQYEQAEKKYKAAIAILGESQTIKQKQDKCTKCKSLLAKAQTAEKESRYSDAAKHYSNLYAIHSLAKYQSKANLMKQKAKQAELAERERQAKIKAESYIRKGTKRIEAKAFYYRTDIMHIVIPEGVTSIEDNAFEGCSSLTTVTIPNTVTSIGKNAFYYCTSLISIEIPNSVTSIGNYAFSYCASLNTIAIPKSVTSIEDNAFYKCISLTSVTIPNSVTSIGSGAFEHCSSLTTVTIPNTVTHIGRYAFSGSGLTSVTIPNSVTSIGESAFLRCANLHDITLPERFRDANVGQKYCKNVTYYSKESDIPSFKDMTQNHLSESLQGREWIRVSSLRPTHDFDCKRMFPRNIEFNKMRVSFSKVSSPQYCYIRICYSDTKGVALEFAFQSTPRYYINGKLQPDSFVSRGRRNKDQIYEYDLNELCGTRNKKFIIESWQENFLPEQVEILAED